ncbi:GAF domain-containing protein [Streptomyces sp. NPDC023723]|uniref:GAF domain-containing protein n=1 Tax=Streptomyces sp. NPDC023723 TaxID=3154323 RepID=UPI003409D325
MTHQLPRPSASADRPTLLLPRRPADSPARQPTTGTQPGRPPARQQAELQGRFELIQRLGLPTGAHQDYDHFADELAERTGFLYGFVNLFLEQQTFIGLHQPPTGSGYVIVGRTMSLEHGWCPEVVSRQKALPLPDVHASPRFSGNHVVDAVGIRSYFGAPLIHSSGITLGTVCVIDPDRRPLSEARRLRDLVTDTGSQVMRHITRVPAR